MIDTDILYKKLINKPELSNIPIMYIVSVAVAVVELLNDGSVWNILDKEDIA